MSKPVRYLPGWGRGRNALTGFGTIEEESHRVPDVSIVESSAELLYGLIHQRYIITRQGLQQMVRLFFPLHWA